MRRASRERKADLPRRKLHRPPGELAGEIEQELLDVRAWSSMLWCRLRDLDPRIAAAYSSNQQQEDLNQYRRGDPQDNQAGDGYSRIAMLDEAIDNAPCANGDSEHHGHQDEADGLRIEVTQSPPAWPVGGRGRKVMNAKA
jgi:hypothetical protein